MKLTGSVALLACSHLLMASGFTTSPHLSPSSRIYRRFGDSITKPASFEAQNTQHGLSATPFEFPKNPSPFSTIKSGIQNWTHRPRNEEVLQWRALAFSFFSSLFLFHRAIDVKLASLWAYLTTSSSLIPRIFRTDSYEWVLAVTAFFFYIHFFWYADVSVRKASEQGKIHPWRKYRLQDRFEADKHRRSVERKLRRNGETPFQNEVVTDYSEVTKQTGWNWKAWTCEVWVYVVPLLTWDILSPRRHRRLAAFGAPTTIQVLRDITCGLLLYDILFFTGHILMHKIPLIYRTIHAKHHQEPEVRAGDVVRLSMVEEVLEVGFSIIALNALGAHPISRSIYNLIITFLLTELHCGFDFPWTPQNVVPFGLATGSRRHHFHHRNGKHYYQKFFFHVDRLFGYFQKDDGSLHGDSVKPNPHIPPAWQ
jgi:sterol desaturase/sphingolipid hydroxylase (fatty acid hydroxylase superfamily)